MKCRRLSLGVKRRGGRFLLYFLGTRSDGLSKQHLSLDAQVPYGRILTARFSPSCRVQAFVPQKRSNETTARPHDFSFWTIRGLKMRRIASIILSSNKRQRQANFSTRLTANANGSVYPFDVVETHRDDIARAQAEPH